MKLGRKEVREAEREWVPYVLVVGERELSGADLSVRPRLGDLVEMTLDASVGRLAAETAGRPRRPANTPRLLSRRPVFVG